MTKPISIRHGFHHNFCTQTIWILHLAVCDFIFCIFCAPMYFIPFLGYRYPQGHGWDTMCTAQIIVADVCIWNDWLLLGYITMTRAINLKWPDKWKAFCNNRICLVLLLLSSWFIQGLIISPRFAQV